MPDRRPARPPRTSSSGRSRPNRRPPPAPPRPAAPSPEAGINVTRIGENAFSLDEATVAQLTTNINQFMTQVRVIPYFEGDKSAGERMAAIRPGSAFDQLGFRGGASVHGGPAP